MRRATGSDQHAGGYDEGCDVGANAGGKYSGSREGFALGRPAANVCAQMRDSSSGGYEVITEVMVMASLDPVVSLLDSVDDKG